jgi:hypothetical protein
MLNKLTGSRIALQTQDLSQQQRDNLVYYLRERMDGNGSLVP